MKKIILLALLTFSIFAAYAQKEISEQEMKNMKNQVEAAALKFRKTLEKETKNQLSINFQLDTFRIEEMMRLRMEFDWSTSGSVQAVYDAETEYDKLLNKYYKILLGDLEETEKEVLKKAQRNWIAFRDAERELRALLIKEKYSGGGTIQRQFLAAHYLGLTTDRVVALYNHLWNLEKYGNE